MIPATAALSEAESLLLRSQAGKDNRPQKSEGTLTQVGKALKEESTSATSIRNVNKVALGLLGVLALLPVAPIGAEVFQVLNALSNSIKACTVFKHSGDLLEQAEGKFEKWERTASSVLGLAIASLTVVKLCDMMKVFSVAEGFGKHAMLIALGGASVFALVINILEAVKSSVDIGVSVRKLQDIKQNEEKILLKKDVWSTFTPTASLTTKKQSWGTKKAKLELDLNLDLNTASSPLYKIAQKPEANRTETEKLLLANRQLKIDQLANKLQLSEEEYAQISPQKRAKYDIKHENVLLQRKKEHLGIALNTLFIVASVAATILLFTLPPLGLAVPLTMASFLLALSIYSLGLDWYRTYKVEKPYQHIHVSAAGYRPKPAEVVTA